jgi:hypothetical protein
LQALVMPASAAARKSQAGHTLNAAMADFQQWLAPQICV